MEPVMAVDEAGLRKLWDGTLLPEIFRVGI
jgi:hypothetical protein